MPFSPLHEGEWSSFARRNAQHPNGDASRHIAGGEGMNSAPVVTPLRSPSPQFPLKGSAFGRTKGYHPIPSHVSRSPTHATFTRRFSLQQHYSSQRHLSTTRQLLSLHAATRTSFHASLRHPQPLAQELSCLVGQPKAWRAALVRQRTLDLLRTNETGQTSSPTLLTGESTRRTP